MSLVTILTKTDAKALNIMDNTGSLMFPSKFWECSGYCNLPKIRKTLSVKGRIKVFVMTNAHEEYENVLNTSIPYKWNLCCNKDHIGARLYKDGTMYVSDYPAGHAYIITK
jgi:hypothetical protein